MAVEIERKFLVVSQEWREGAVGQRFCQGYLARSRGVTVRVRRAGTRAFLTVKGEAAGRTRPEFEYEIPVADAEAMLATLCDQPLIEKVRFEVSYGGRLWHVDEFAAENAGLVLAEVELADAADAVALPPWVGAEVTDDMRYRNSELSASPRPRARKAD